jgi:hypothetical protein
VRKAPVAPAAGVDLLGQHGSGAPFLCPKHQGAAVTKRVHGDWTASNRKTKFPVETRQIGDDRRQYEADYAAALELADGDHRRIVIGADGSITVVNAPVGRRERHER